MVTLERIESTFKLNRVRDCKVITFTVPYEIGRPSLLFLRAEENKGKIDISVGGKVVMIAKGEFI